MKLGLADLVGCGPFGQLAPQGHIYLAYHRLQVNRCWLTDRSRVWTEVGGAGG
jgi:hypothetical protein